MWNCVTTKVIRGFPKESIAFTCKCSKVHWGWKR
jgi:hypothetical protein